MGSSTTKAEKDERIKVVGMEGLRISVNVLKDEFQD
ncbi:aminoglycoside 6-adenylyltransferase [Xylanivirga thermophila]|nr:aminoglycoside 6-adenylyltransferase [Xylanivirga thermophila]